MSTAIVLSGGGAKGSFQVGALRFLYWQGVRPDVIAGTSVGAINGAKLAEGEGLDSQGFQGLLHYWLGLRTKDDMFRREQWLDDAHPIVRDTIESSSGAGLDASVLTTGDYTAWGDLAWLPQALERAQLAVAGAVSSNEVLRNLKLIAGAQALYNLDPIERKLRYDADGGTPGGLDESLVNNWADKGGRLRLAAVSLESGHLRYVDERGRLLERDNYTPVTLSIKIAPVCASLDREIRDLLEQRRQAQDELSSAAPSAKSKIIARIGGLNAKIGEKSEDLKECERLNPPQRRQAVVDLATAVLASASIPALFRAVAMEGETYVDGGVREVLPLQVAVDLGATQIYAVSASRPDVLRAASHAGANMSQILMRALSDVMINEVTRDDANIVRNGNLKIIHIQPSFDVHEMTMIEPGFLRVAMDYGFMRAADVVTGRELEERGQQNWCDDSLPDGSQAGGDETWNWVTFNPKPYSGAAAHRASVKSGVHQHYFSGATSISVLPDDVLFAYIWLPSQVPPSQIMLQWNDGTWEHRAYWGQSKIGWGVEGTASRRYMGPLPPSDTWVRLEVPASSVGLDGREINGMAFTLYGGEAVWDIAGRSPGVTSRGFTSSDRITRLRQQIRSEEQAYFAAPTVASRKALQAKKRQVRDAARDRLILGLTLPPHIEKAWMNWEWFAPAGLPTQPWEQNQTPSAVPPACRAIEAKLADLEHEKTALQSDLAGAAGSQKTRLVGQIGRLNKEIEQQKAGLEDCIRQNTSLAALDPMRHGLLFEGSGPEIYLLYGGSKLWIRDNVAFQGMGFQSTDVLGVSDEVLAALPTDQPVDGTLLATKGDPKIYVMEGGRLRWVTAPAVLDRKASAWDNSWPHVRQLPSDTLKGIPSGPDYT